MVTIAPARAARLFSLPSRSLSLLSSRSEAEGSASPIPPKSEKLRKSVLLKGTASAVPKVSRSEPGFSRWGTSLFPEARPHRPVPDQDQGFTLLELMIVMVVIGLLAAIAIPAYTTNIRHAREAVLKSDLHTLRTAIDSYTVDKQKAPQSLDDLVQSGYLKVMPIDPFTHRSDTWMPVQADTLMSLDQTESGIDDVHSGSQETAIDGTSYNTW
jgi:general secretion pathway protein G